MYAEHAPGGVMHTVLGTGLMKQMHDYPNT